MKYGDTLRQRSIPAWSHHNIDYDDIKYFIKEHTTPGKGKTISIPGRGDDKLSELETSLFLILQDQHERINLFVKSKAGEIQRRLDHSKRHLHQLAVRRSSTADTRVPISRLERYGRLENDVIKAGDEIRSLARFIAAQRTAFRKLLKKYKKWTGSAELEDRFRYEVLDDPKGFTKLDLGPLLDDYSHTQQSIRALYEDQLRQSAGALRSPPPLSPQLDSSTISQLQDALSTGSKVSFDTAIATVPLGKAGTFASYFVHPENLVELQMLLLQYTRFYLSRSRSNSIATPLTSESPTTSILKHGVDIADYGLLAADNLDRFTREQSSLTVHDREHSPGSFPQRAKAVVRWNNTEDALVCLRSRSGKTKSAYLKRKHVQDFFNDEVDFSATQDLNLPDSVETVEELRRELLKEDMKPLFRYSSCRTRFSGLDDSADCLVLATLDNGITIQKADQMDHHTTNFPFALLLVRQEGSPRSGLLTALDASHLVERVHGFSLEYNAVWHTHQPSSIPPPFWLPMLSQDIRKLPPAMPRRSGATGKSNSGTQTIGSSSSVTGGTDSATAVEQESPSQLGAPPLKSFRRKRKRRAYAEANVPSERYWSEYDHPEDGDAEQDAYVIYIDPDEKSTFDDFWDKVVSLFRKKENPMKEPLLSAPVSPHEEDVSSDDEELGMSRARNGFGTFGHYSLSHMIPGRPADEATGLSPFSGTCFAASLAIIIVAYILHSTGKKKFLREVHYGVLFAILCSLAFMLLGFLSVLRTKHPVSYSAWTVSITVLLIDAVGSGGLIAWMLG